MPVPRFVVNKIPSLEAYLAFYNANLAEYDRRRQTELDLIRGWTGFKTRGYCYICGRSARFKTDFLYSDGSRQEGKRIPNWRERVECQGCGMNNRIRACIHFFEEHLGARSDSEIYIAEQTTPLYQFLKSRYSSVTGSEHLGDRVPYGTTDPQTGFRNENFTNLSFTDASLDFILSFDVFEHIPNYQEAFRESYRCLKPGGSLLFSVPFAKGTQDTLVRARISNGGEIEHLQEPQYHGDPISEKGCLCFYSFGWDILDQLRNLGFREANANVYWSEELGYLGVEQLLFSATK